MPGLACMDNYLRGVRGKDLHSYIRVSLCFGRNNLALKDGKGVMARVQIMRSYHPCLIITAKKGLLSAP